MRDEKSQFAITDEGFVIYKRHLLPFNVCDAAWLRASSSHNNADPVAFMRSDSDCSEPSPLAAFSEVCFVVREAQVDGFRSQVASMCLAQTLAVSLALATE